LITQSKAGRASTVNGGWDHARFSPNQRHRRAEQRLGGAASREGAPYPADLPGLLKNRRGVGDGQIDRSVRGVRVPAGSHAVPVSWPSVRDRQRHLYDFELEPEVRDWLDSLSDSDFKRVDEVCGMLAEKGTELGGPWSDHLEGPVWELRIRLRDVAARVTYWCTPGGTIVLLTAFRKTRQHDQRQIDRAVRAQELCERGHRGSAAETYGRQV
jgi:hypothetical protein